MSALPPHLLPLFLRVVLSLLAEGAPLDALARYAGQDAETVREALGKLPETGEIHGREGESLWRHFGREKAERLLRALRERLAGRPATPFVEGLLQLAGDDRLTGIRNLLDSLPGLLARSAVTELGALLEIGMTRLAGQKDAAFSDSEYNHFLKAVCSCCTYVILLEIKQPLMLRLIADIRETAERRGNERVLCLVDVMECMLEGLLSDQMRSDRGHTVRERLLERLQRINDAELSEMRLYFMANPQFNGCRTFMHYHAQLRARKSHFYLSDAIRYLYTYGACAASLYLGHCAFSLGLCEAVRDTLRRKSPHSLRTWNIYHAIVLFENGDTEKGLERVTESLCALAPHSETRPYLLACHVLARFQLLAGHIRQSHRMMGKLLSLAARHGISASYPVSWFWDLHLHYRLHGLPDFEGFSLEEDLERGLASSSESIRAFALRTRAMLNKTEGDRAGALPLLEMSAALFRENDMPCELAKTWLYMAHADPANAAALRGKALSLLRDYTCADYSGYPFFPGASAVEPLFPARLAPQWAHKAAEACSAFLSRVSVETLDDFFVLLLNLVTVELDAQWGMALRMGKEGAGFVTACNIREARVSVPLYEGLLARAAADRQPKRLRTDTQCLLCLPVAAEQEKLFFVLSSPNTRKIFSEACEPQLDILSRSLSAELLSFLRLQRYAEKLKKACAEHISVSMQANEEHSIEYYGSQMRKLLEHIRHAAATDLSILLLGETGVGKEVLARRVHAMSGSKGPFVAVHPVSTPETLFESLFFGNEKGALTGASTRKIGFFELADNGTLFIDEVGDIPLPLQAKLLRVLQEKTFVRVGGVRERTSRFRLLAATNKDLWKEVREKRFREDLFFRISVLPLTLPPLRERPEDIPILAASFLEAFRQRYGRNLPSLTPEHVRLLKMYRWPGNIRELKSVMERAAVLSDGDKLDFSFLLPPLDTGERVGHETEGLFADLPSMETLEKRYMAYLLEKTNGRICGSHGIEAILKMSRPTVYAKLKRYGIR